MHQLRLRIFNGDNNVWTGNGPTGSLIVDMNEREYSVGAVQFRLRF